MVWVSEKAPYTKAVLLDHLRTRRTIEEHMIRFMRDQMRHRLSKHWDVISEVYFDEDEIIASGKTEEGDEVVFHYKMKDYFTYWGME